MPGLAPGICVLTVLEQKSVDGRVKAGHDGIKIVMREGAP
jgi:hypothetical protein